MFEAVKDVSHTINGNDCYYGHCNCKKVFLTLQIIVTVSVLCCVPIPLGAVRAMPTFCELSAAVKAKVSFPKIKK